MPNYKISVAKDGKKYKILFKAENEASARNRVHLEGYSILDVEEVTQKAKIENAFIFEATKLGEYKHGKIAGNDIFKAYVKLKRDLGYDIKSIYSEKDKDLSFQEKQKICKELEEEYNLFYSTASKSKSEEMRERLLKEREKKHNLDNFYMKKNLEDTNKLIESVLLKLKNIISGDSIIKPTIEERAKFENIFNSIIKLKKSTNISKLRQIGEVGLKKIGEYELRYLEKTKDEKSRELLQETNKLLKEIGSKEKFIEKDKDISYQLELIGKDIKLYFKTLFTKKKVEGIDKESHSYNRTNLYLSKYKEKLKENTLYIIKNSFKLAQNEELREMTFLKRSVIKQNIILLKAKLNGKVYSYTFIKKGIEQLSYSIYSLFLGIRNYLFGVIIIYTFIFFIYLNVNTYLGLNDYNYDGIFVFLLFFILYFLLYLSKRIFFIILSFVFLFFITILGVINF